MRPENIIFDGTNQRLLVTNFGNAVDLDPPRLGLDNDSIELNVPGSITNTPAADVFSAAVIVCQLLFGISSMQLMQQQLKTINYDLDLWLQKALEAESFPTDALGYLEERRGLWSLLKGMIRPNPLRKVRLFTTNTYYFATAHTLLISLLNMLFSENNLRLF